MYKLPRYSFEGGAIVDLTLVDRLMSENEFAEGLPLNEARIERIREVEASIMIKLSILGYDINERFIDDSCYHFFDEEGFEGFRKQLMASSKVKGVYKRGQIYILEDEQEAITMGRTMNRVLRSVGHNVLAVKGNDIKEIQNGYASDLLFNIFNEGLIELMTIDLIHKKHPDYVPINSATALYVDMIVDYIARTSKLNYNGILSYLVDGYFNGSQDRISIISSHFGKPAFDKLAGLSLHTSTFEYIEKTSMVMAIGMGDIPDSRELDSYKVVSGGK